MRNENASLLVTIVIVYHANPSYLLRCLECLAAQTYTNFEIIVVDNGSIDGLQLGLEAEFPALKISIKHLDKHLGFAAANNVATHLAAGSWIVLLNSDAFPQSDWLASLINASKQNPEFSTFASRQLQANAPEAIDSAGDIYHVSGLAWKRFMGYPAAKYGLKQTEVFSASGAAAMYMREAFLDVGGFDEDFFSYFEDVDIGFRLQLRSNRCLYVPEAVVYHIGSATFGEKSDFAFYHSHRNLIWTYVKNMPSSMFWLYLPAHIMANVIYTVYYTLRGRGKVLWRAKIDAVRDLPKFIRKRRQLQARNLATNSVLKKLMAKGVLQPYLLGYQMRRAK